MSGLDASLGVNKNIYGPMPRRECKNYWKEGCDALNEGLNSPCWSKETEECVSYVKGLGEQKGVTR